MPTQNGTSMPKLSGAQHLGGQVSHAAFEKRDAVLAIRRDAPTASEPFLDEAEVVSATAIAVGCILDRHAVPDTQLDPALGSAEVSGQLLLRHQDRPARRERE
jgi:hypothetical protein